MWLPAEDHRGIDTYSVAVIDGAESFDALMDAFGRIEAEHRRKGRCFVTLDDLSQCVYTSGHARSKYGLGTDVEYPEEDSRERVAAYDAARFRAAMAAFGDPARAVSWESLCESATMADGAADALVALNQNPSLVLDGRHVVQCLPTDDGADLLADLPNGYFLGDWSPFGCYCFARRLSERHGYTLLGIGARTLGFLSTIGADERDWGALIADLRELYGDPDSSAWAALAPVLYASRVLLLGYAEDFTELASEDGS